MDPETTRGSSWMMALRAHQRGGPEQLSYEPAPRPTPKAGEIRVAVGAAAITFAELTWPETWESAGVDRTPVIPAHEFGGTVDAVGPGVDDPRVGDSVFGLVPFDRDGAAADFVVLPADCVTHKASTVDDVEAAAAVLPVLTAWEALRDHVNLASGQRLLVRGGTGAVGAFLTQFAHETGAEITVTVSSASAEDYAKRLGADHVIVAADLQPGQLAGFDAAIDAVGDELPEWIYAAVRPGGRLVVLQQPPDQALARRHGVEAIFFVVSTRRDRLEELAARLAQGRIDVAIAQTFPLAAGRAAYKSSSQPRPRPGKTVLLVNND
jgi:NADPH:quinone reductase-like Zn-dependent oxidoreductase